MRNNRIKELNDQITELQRQVTAEELLESIWIELGPYTGDLSKELRYRLQDHFGFDDSE